MHFMYKRIFKTKQNPSFTRWKWLHSKAGRDQKTYFLSALPRKYPVEFIISSRILIRNVIHSIVHPYHTVIRSVVIRSIIIRTVIISSEVFIYPMCYRESSTHVIHLTFEGTQYHSFYAWKIRAERITRTERTTSERMSATEQIMSK
jgi:hypothetical protein